MKVLYVDEAGCLGALPSATSDIQPVFVLAGLVIDSSAVGALTSDFLSLKRTFFPNALSSQHKLDDILTEVKGSDVRKNIALGNPRAKRAAVGFLDKLFNLIQRHDGRIFGRIWIKEPAGPFNGKAVYTYSMQDICEVFQVYLEQLDETGVIVADSRNKPKNSNVAHSIFTQKFRSTGDAFPRMLEMPMFGHSDNHAGIQIADLLCSAVAFPAAIETYCKPHLTSVHTRDYAALKSRFSPLLKTRQFRYQDANGRWRGGLTVSDAIGKLSGAALFR